jgi:hypothetical protein
LVACGKDEGLLARRPAEKDIRVIEALLPKVDCIAASQWDRTYFHPHRYVRFGGFAWNVYDYSTVNVGLLDAADAPPNPRTDGRPTVRAGIIMSEKLPYDLGSDGYYGRRFAGASYEPSVKRLEVTYCDRKPFSDDGRMKVVLYAPD